MNTKRVDDFGKASTWYRTGRMIEEGQKWYFQTREETIEGPYEDEIDAAQALEAYIGAKVLGLLSTTENLTQSTVIAPSLELLAS